MKKLLYCSIITVAAFVQGNKTSAQSANKALSNLTAPTAVNVDLLPGSTNSYDLGSKKYSWKNVYVKGAYYLSGSKFISNAGTYNTFIGINTGSSNTTGYDNTANGAYALYANNTGAYNTANGAYSLYTNTIGYYNTATGTFALYSNSTGNYNTANGVDALVNNTTGYYNTANGVDALYKNKTGNSNTAIGNYALYNTTASDGNTAVGFNAGDSYDNGYYNVFVGANTDVNGADYYNDIAIGQGTICTDVNQARFGNSSTVSIGGYTNWSNISDGRVKRNIKQNVPGLAFINKLQPITYNLDLTAADNILQAQRKDSTGKIIPLSNIETSARKAKEQIIYTGFVAQDVEKSAKEMNYDFSGVDAAKNSKDLYGLRYSDFVVPLVKAVQELSKMNDDKDAKINDLETRLSKLEAMMNVSNQSTVNGQQSTVVSSASLQQNIPNPFTNSTSISYSLPQTYSSAKIIITDNKGVALKQINLNAKGKGSVQVDASTLASGAYQYILYVDGRIIGKKQMISSK